MPLLPLVSLVLLALFVPSFQRPLPILIAQALLLLMGVLLILLLLLLLPVLLLLWFVVVAIAVGAASAANPIDGCHLAFIR